MSLRTFNLPPGICASDIDPPCCPDCEGSGEIENPNFGKPGYESEDLYITCEQCAGLGTPNERSSRRR